MGHAGLRAVRNRVRGVRGVRARVAPSHGARAGATSHSRPCAARAAHPAGGTAAPREAAPAHADGAGAGVSVVRRVRRGDVARPVARPGTRVRAPLVSRADPPTVFPNAPRVTCGRPGTATQSARTTAPPPERERDTRSASSPTSVAPQPRAGRTPRQAGRSGGVRSMAARAAADMLGAAPGAASADRGGLLIQRPSVSSSKPLD